MRRTAKSLLPPASVRAAAVGAVLLAGCTAAPSDPEPAQPGATEASSRAADEWLGIDRGATFRAHVERIRKVQVLSAASLARLGTTWEEELRYVERLYADAVTRSDAYYALVALVRSLHDGHADLRADDLAPADADATLPFSVRVEYDGPLARYVVRAGGALAAGVTITAVDGVPIEQLERERRAWFRGSSPEGLREDLARWLASRSPELEPSPAAGSTSTVTARADDGSEASTPLTWRAREDAGPRCPPYAEPCGPDADGDYATEPSFVGLGYCVYSAQDPGTRIVRYRTLYYPEARDAGERDCLARKLPLLSYPLGAREAAQAGPHGLLQIDQGELLDHLARTGARRVLFDVRENTGGDFDPVFFGAFTAGSYAQPLKRFVFGSWFREDPSRIRDASIFVGLLDGSPVPDGAASIEEFLRANPTSEASPPIPFYCQTPACAAGEARLASQSNVVFQAAILVGPRCFSACDDFVAMFRDNGIARTIGVSTAAGDAPYGYDLDLPLANGRAAQVHLTVGISSRPGATTLMEGNPTPVDVPLAPSASNRGRYVAEALARAPF